VLSRDDQRAIVEMFVVVAIRGVDASDRRVEDRPQLVDQRLLMGQPLCESRLVIVSDGIGPEALFENPLRFQLGQAGLEERSVVHAERDQRQRYALQVLGFQELQHLLGRAPLGDEAPGLAVFARGLIEHSQSL